VSGANLYWNHKWFYTEPAPQGTVNTTGLEQQISVKVNNTTTYCLKAPAAGVSPAYVTFVGCSSSDDQKFTRYNTTSDYTTSYRFVTKDGRCLSLGPQWSGWSTIVAVACTGGNEQKWNAPANPVSASTSGTRELFGSGS
jgi:hypothetical protein